MNFLKILDVVPGWLYAIALAIVLAGAGVQTVRLDGAKMEVAQIQRDRAADNLKREQAAFAESESHAKESLRRIEAQQENERVQSAQLAAARADAARYDAAAGQLRGQLADSARRWSATLDHPPVIGEREAAVAAIGVSADMLSRVGAAAGAIAAYSDAAHLAGLKCQADYGALKPATP